MNGEVVWSGGGLEIPGQQAFSGTVELPSGGWVAARAVGGETVWPSMDSYAFAHTGPVWIDHRGSTEPGARRAAAEELLAVLEVARNRLMAGYGDTPIPQLVARFDEAEQRLRTLVR